ncbi:MAG: hypothetical protein ABIQ16_23270 [Polyangiaceae bacterium]
MLLQPIDSGADGIQRCAGRLHIAQLISSTRKSSPSPRFLRDGVYRMFAKVRLSLRAPACLVPTPEERARFLKA